jgi:cytochrome b pre-mRNA-processing protein 3
MPAWPFSPSRASKDARLLLHQITTVSRNPALFGEGRVPDTLDGRFELITLHAALALVRLGQAPEAEALAQAFVDALFQHLDWGLREDGVGDLAVPKRIYKLAGVFYRRADGCTKALSAQGSALQSVLTRNVLAGQTVFAEALTQYVRSLGAAQAELAWPALLTEEGWRRFVA